MISQINTKVNSLYTKVLTFFYKLFYSLLQFPTRNTTSKFNNNLVITYKDRWIITDIELSDDGLFHGHCTYKNSPYCLQGATIDLLVQDLIEGIEELEADTTFEYKDV
jgi:hypothetical protein